MIHLVRLVKSLYRGYWNLWDWKIRLIGYNTVLSSITLRSKTVLNVSFLKHLLPRGFLNIGKGKSHRALGSSAWAVGLWETLALPPVSTAAMRQPGTARKHFALGSPKAQDNCLATHFRNELFGLEVGTGHSIIFVCLKGSQRDYHSKNCITLLHGLCCLQKWDFSLGWQSHTNPPSKSSFFSEQN